MDTEVLVAIITIIGSVTSVLITARMNYKIKVLEIESKKTENAENNKIQKVKQTKTTFNWLALIFAFAFLTTLAYMFFPKITINPKEHSFSGEMRFETDKGENMPAKFSNLRGINVVNIAKKGNYKLTKPYKSGQKFKIYLKSEQNAYVYAIAVGRNNKINIIYPYNEYDNAFFESSDNEIAIPQGSAVMQLDKNTGKDIFCLLYSAEKLDIYKIKNDLEKNTNGNFIKTLYNVLGNKIVEAQKINYDNNKIKFSAKSKKTILPVIVIIDHI